MTENEFIDAIVKESEGNQLAFFADVNFMEIGKTVCAFLNTDGGRIVIGIREGGNVNRLRNVIDEYNELRNFIHTQIVPESLIGIRKEPYKETEIILIEVIEGNKKPYSINGKSYVRHGVNTSAANEYDMSILIRANSTDDYTWEKTPALEASFDNLDIIEINKAIDLANTIGRSSKFNPQDPLKFLTHFQLYRSNQFTNAAIVLFAKEPTYFLPQCRVRIIDFGNGKSSDRYENTLLIEDNLFETYTIVQNFFKKNLPIISEFKDNDWKRNDQYIYPMKALDEAIINALMHRDYSDITGEVFVGIYPDKIEIINSGNLSLSDKELKKSHSSNPPNPNITHIVYLCGIIEKVGRGTLLINELFEERGLESPTWENKNGTVTLTLYNVQKKIDVNYRMVKFLSDFEEDYFTRENYMSFFDDDVKERTARSDIQKLLEGGWLRKIGDGPHTRYAKTSKELPDNAG